MTEAAHTKSLLADTELSGEGYRGEKLAVSASLFLNRRPFIDTRSPGEYLKGSIPGAVNLPLMSDDERALVGTCYKQKGQDAAIELGRSLVAGDIKAQRLRDWTNQLARFPQSVLFCFRGGLRTRVSLDWIAEAGQEMPFVAGGYKAMRRFLLESIDKADSLPWLVIAGRTGSGKTLLLKAAQEQLVETCVLDLEGLANHRGSAFGSEITPQPSQIDFENQLAVELLSLYAARPRQVLLEDEGRLIGRSFVPQPIQTSIKRSPAIELVASLEDRLAGIAHDYVVRRHQDLLAAHAGDSALSLVEDHLLAGFTSIRKRLGDERFGQLSALLAQAFVRYRSTGDPGEHYAWIEPLLTEYYDPMYAHQASRVNREVLFRGTQQEVLEWLADSGVQRSK